MADETKYIQQVVPGIVYGYVKCTYTEIFAEDGQRLFSFQNIDGTYTKKPIVYTINYQLGIERLKCFLTPYSREAFEEILRRYGWRIDENYTLQEIPLYGEEVINEPHIEIQSDGSITKYSTTTITVAKKYTDARHTKIYAWGVKLLPYILDPDMPIYVRESTVRWNINDKTKNTEDSTDESITEQERLAAEMAAKAKRTKTLAALTAIASLLTSK